MSAWREDCPVCSGTELLPSLKFEALPVLCNEFYDDVDSARAANIGPLVITCCRACAHIFNAAYDDSQISYAQNYDSSQWFSKSFVTYVDQLIERLNNAYSLAGKTVIDIGCGKGDLLKRLCALSGSRGIGFDKSFERDGSQDTPNNVLFVNDWFGDDHIGVSPDLVICRHVLEHIREPLVFLNSIRHNPSLSPETVFYFEVPNGSYIFQEHGMWELIYEHVSYFTLPSFCTVLENAGFTILNASLAFGRQYLSVEARFGNKRSHCRVPSVAEIERSMSAFTEMYFQKVDYWRNYLTTHKPNRVVVWGAGSKGVTFVNVVPGGNRISALTDLNPRKQGRFAPVTGTPVVSPASLRGSFVESIIVMNPLYRSEIAGEATALGLDAAILLA